MTVRVLINPTFEGADRGDGGIRRVVEAQHRWLPKYDIEIVPNARVAEADIIALHAGTWVDNIRPGTGIVAHCHGLYWEGYDWAKWALGLNDEVIRTLKRADAVTAPSNWVADALRRGTWQDVVPVYHGIEPEHWTTIAGDADSEPRENYVLWNKTRVDPICDPEPVNKLASMAPDVDFVTTFGSAAANVRVTGAMPHDDALRAVRYASVYLATSRETFGIGTLEAMAAGVPVLGWNWGGQAEFVLHEKHGYLATPGDYDDLYKGLRACIAHRDEWGAEARAYALDNFSWEQRIKAYADLYHELHERLSGRCKVSVVITNYNLGKYLPDAVESALQSNLDGVEVVLVDDASTEPLPEVIATLPRRAGNRVRIIRNAENKYLAEALNTGIAASRGNYIVPLDADNKLAPGALEVLSSQLDKYPDLDIAYGKIQFVPEGREHETFVSDWPPAEASLDLQLLHRNQIPSTSMYRRRVWERIGGYRRRCHTAEDADFWSRALAVGFAGRRVTDAVTLVYRDRSDSMSHVQRDWAWHKWYSYAASKVTRLFAAPGYERIPTHEFPLVSVIVPVGPRHTRTVLDALDSIQNQTFRHWEVIVVNDTEDELPWVHSWARVTGPRMFGAKGGAATARNRGLGLVRAPFVLFLDADDYLHPDALRAMYDTIQDTGGFVYSDWFVGETGEVKHAPDFDADDVLRKLPYPVTCMYNRAELAAADVRFDPQFDGLGWEDWDFAIQVVAKAGMRGTRIEAPLFHYRMSTGALREKAYAAREEMKAAIYNKWQDYITGKEKNMGACGGCGGGRSYVGSGAGVTAPNTQADASVAPTVQLEYVPNDATGLGTSSFIGRVTGNRYKFGTDAEHAVRRVYEEDVPGLLALGMFRRVEAATVAASVVGVNLEPLMAQGPPERESHADKGHQAAAAAR